MVTGGAGGIGAAICRRLAGMDMRVVVADVAADPARKLAAELRGIAVELDVTAAESVSAAIQRVRAEAGPIGVLVSAAGWDELRPLLETDEPFTTRVLEINLAGPIRVIRAVLPDMVEMQYGRVVSIASDAGRVGSSMEAVYSAAKGGLIAFTKTVAREMARHGITANTICPGPTDTPLLAGVVGDRPDAKDVIAAMTRGIPLRRLGRPEDVAAAAAYLGSDDAGYVTGQTLSVSGGLTMV